MPLSLIAKRSKQSRRRSNGNSRRRKYTSVTGSASLLTNVIFVAAPARRVDEMRALPGVSDVRPMRKFKKKLDRATSVLNGPAAWAALGGIANAGLGMKIAILDSGIDQTHAAFQDSTLSPPAGFPRCTTGHQEDCAYTNNKVIVARSYVRLLSAGSNPANPALDSLFGRLFAADRDGHGTGVAASSRRRANCYSGRLPPPEARSPSRAWRRRLIWATTRLPDLPVSRNSPAIRH